MGVHLLLTRAELAELTATEQPKRMRKWLQERDWAHEPPARRGDIPKVDRAYYSARMSGALTTAAPHQRARLRLDFMMNPR